MLNETRLAHVSKAKINVISNWREGVALERDANAQIDLIVNAVAVHRWQLGYLHRKDGNKLMSMSKPPFRSAISRYYYSMYHCFRAISFLHHGGDDFESHQELALKLPSDLPASENWKNKLKNARLTRNKADYEPYPRSDSAWRNLALDIKADTDLAVKETKLYLKVKGCVGL